LAAALAGRWLARDCLGARGGGRVLRSCWRVRLGVLERGEAEGERGRSNTCFAPAAQAGRLPTADVVCA
jgi:hypothetical protein